MVLDEAGATVLPAREVEALLALGRHRTVPAGTVLFGEGDAGDHVLYLRTGAVRLSRSSARGRDLVVAVLEGGMLVGEVCVLEGRRRGVTATTSQRSSLVVVPADTFLGLVENRPGLSRALLSLLAARTRTAVDQVAEMALQDALGRVCRRLVEAADDAGVAAHAPAGTIDLPCSQQELGERSGLSREAVVKALRTLHDLGWIAGDGDGRRFRLLDEAALRDRAAL